VEGCIQWDLSPCVEVVDWSESGWLQDSDALTEVACSGQKPEQVGPMEDECGAGGLAGGDQSA